MKVLKFLFLSSCLLLSSQSLLADSPSAVYYETMGGRIYDKWYAEINVPAPLNSHPLYPESAKYATKAKSNWRCKECHGWDYQGNSGAYKSGKHATGIPGVLATQPTSVDQAEKLFTSAHNEIASQMKPVALKAVSQFLTTGLHNMDENIDRKTKKVKSGDAAKGKQNYEAICARCHGLDGKLPDDMKPFAGQMGNPWEVMHKIQNGQPNEEMPAFRVLGMSFVLDTMAYMETLPK
jgi:mono/diheme cytochrome c family protein